MPLNLSDSEKRDVIRYLEAGKPLPEKYRFLLFNDDREVELVWNGKTNEVTNTVLPFQVIEQIDEPRNEEKISMQDSLFDTSGRQITGWTNKLIWGDNKLILSSLKNGPMRKEIEAQGGLKLIYIDPPFDVGADFSMDIKVGEGGDEENFTKKPSVIEEIAYRDTWGKGADSFIAMIYERLKLMYDLLADDGSIYVHCDWRVSAYMKIILDDIFRGGFQREIIWRIGWLSGYKTKAKNWIRNHDTIYFYTKNKDSFTFNKKYIPYPEDYVRRDGNKPEGDGYPIEDTWNCSSIDKMDSIQIMSFSSEKTGYATQKNENLLERIILASSNPGDLVADFFCGSGTTLAVAEKLGRKWIGSDLGKFGIHTARKRMVGVQRELKKEKRDFRAFEILNVGKYERERFVAVNDDLRMEEKIQQAIKKEKEFISLVLNAYKAEPVTSFENFVGKKRDRLVAIGPVNMPVSSRFVEFIIEECLIHQITKVDILGFDYEMGLDASRAKEYSIDIELKVIPREVFDKRAIERGQVKFYDVAYLNAEAHVVKKGNVREVSIELTDFSCSYTQDDIEQIIEGLKPGGSKIILEQGKLMKISKDTETEEVSQEILTKKWSDWIDYWAVDFDFNSRKEMIRVIENGEVKEVWTGDYIFDNEWQSFRTKKNRTLELVSAPREMPKGSYKVAVKVVDIFGNDTTRVIDVQV